MGKLSAPPPSALHIPLLVNHTFIENSAGTILYYILKYFLLFKGLQHIFKIFLLFWSYFNFKSLQASIPNSCYCLSLLFYFMSCLFFFMNVSVYLLLLFASFAFNCLLSPSCLMFLFWHFPFSSVSSSDFL